MKNADKNSQDQVIDENLKKVFDETLEEGIPDRFKMLLSQLKQQDNERGSSK
ncbi:NepR family anti-sigma factor [Sulfitobacter sp. JB4-11]|uniref:NepR family anti-sigma factor n=1 Tax=Sulfitobacter rhodophyticola TaxID=3238304 RepID=UPI0035118AEB